MSAEIQWIDLDGAANVRDLGGLPAGNGKTVRPRRLIRSDNLQGLSESDIEQLIVKHHVRSVADLRTQTEIDSEGPGPLTADPRVHIKHLSLFPEAGDNTDVAATGSDDGPVVLPWHKRDDGQRRSAAMIYRRYLDDRPDSVVAALRLVAQTDGATIVHCAAGKDRTGVVTAIALDAVGVDRRAIVDDFVRTGERMRRIVARLAASHTYADDIRGVPFEQHLPRPVTMENFLSGLDESHGSTSGWLRAHGWTDADDAALRQALLTE